MSSFVLVLIFYFDSFLGSGFFSGFIDGCLLAETSAVAGDQ